MKETENWEDIEGYIKKLQDRIEELEKAFERQNAQDPELLEKVSGFVNADHGLLVDMEDGTSRTGLYIETGFLRNLLKEASRAKELEEERDDSRRKQLAIEVLATGFDCKKLAASRGWLYLYGVDQ